MSTTLLRSQVLFAVSVVLLSASGAQGEPKLVGGNAIPTYASQELDTAVVRKIAARGDSSYRYLSEALELKPDVSLYILSEQDWPAFSEQVFGMPSYDEKTRRLIVAGERSSFWGGFVEFLSQAADPADFKHVQEVYGRAGGAVDLGVFFDLLVVHELGHAFHIEAGKLAYPRAWLGEFVANLALQHYVVNREPGALRTLLAFPRAMAGIPLDLVPRHKLAEFDYPGSNGVTPLNYVWFQAKFHLGAEYVFEVDGRECLKYLVKGRLPGRLASDAELARLLEGGTCDGVSQLIDRW